MTSSSVAKTPRAKSQFKNVTTIPSTVNNKTTKASTAPIKRATKKQKLKGSLLAKIKEPRPADKEAKIRAGLKRQMHRLVQEAKDNIVKFPHFKFLRAARSPPLVQLKADRDASLPKVKWEDGKPRCAISADGVDLVYHIPGAMRAKAATQIYAAIIKLTDVVKLQVCAGADGATRNAAASYIQTPGGKAGVIKAAKLWHAIGHTHDDPTIAADIIKNGKTLNAVMELFPELGLLSQRVNDVLDAADPAHFAALQELCETAEKAFPLLKALNSVDELKMEGREFMLNRQTPEHDDRQDPFWGWAVLAALGEFQGGDLYFPALNLQSRFLPGDLILLRGRALKHRILPFTGKQRISVAHFTHQSLWDAFDLTPPQTIHAV